MRASGLLPATLLFTAFFPACLPHAGNTRDRPARPRPSYPNHPHDPKDPSGANDPNQPSACETAVRDPGRVTIHRLNRSEYNNTVSDLLGLSLRPADDFPPDDHGYGFDNNADVLALAPALVEKYQ